MAHRWLGGNTPFYLGRHVHGVAWVTTGNMLGVGWLRDVVRIPEYVRQANAEPEHERYVMKIMRLTRVPPVNGSHIMGMVMLGTWYYYVVGGMASFHIPRRVYRSGVYRRRVCHERRRLGRRQLWARIVITQPHPIHCHHYLQQFLEPATCRIVAYAPGRHFCRRLHAPLAL